MRTAATARTAPRKVLGPTATASKCLGATAKRIVGPTPIATEDRTVPSKTATFAEAAPRSQPLIPWSVDGTSPCARCSGHGDCASGEYCSRSYYWDENTYQSFESKYAPDARDAGAGTPLTTAPVRVAATPTTSATSPRPPIRTKTQTERATRNRDDPKQLFASFPPIAGSTPRTPSTTNCTSAIAAPLVKKPSSGAKAFALPTLGLTAATRRRAPSRR